MKFDEIETDRLTLIAMTEAALDAEQKGWLAAEIGCEVPASWPPENWEPHVFDWLRSHYARHPEAVGWHRYIALRHEDGERVLVGTVGGFRQEEVPGEAEIGYSVVGEWQGRGFATEAAGALIQHIRGCGQVGSVIAHTYPHLTASVRVMEKCGLAYDGEGTEPGTVRYRMGFGEAK
jgi:ribosomal-protein-alanine N-acetyltransferase